MARNSRVVKFRKMKEKLQSLVTAIDEMVNPTDRRRKSKTPTPEMLKELWKVYQTAPLKVGDTITIQNFTYDDYYSCHATVIDTFSANPGLVIAKVSGSSEYLKVKGELTLPELGGFNFGDRNSSWSYDLDGDTDLENAQ